MKKWLFLVGLSGTLWTPNLSAAYDGTVVLQGGPYQYGTGGEFTATTTGGLGIFQTFCIEYSEDIGFNAAYNYRKNTGSVAGGGGGQDAIDSNTGLSMDKISIGTAWLYSQFRAGTLANYNFANKWSKATPETRKQDAGALQNAIWYLENEIPSLILGGADGTKFYNEAKAATGKNDTTIFDDSNGAFGVVALNLFDGPDATSVSVREDGTTVTYHLNQDQLAICVPEPATYIAGALLLLPFGLGAVRSLRKTRKA